MARWTDKAGVKTEHVEQAKFCTQVSFEFRELVFYAVPNGGFRKLSEAIRLKAEGARAGAPDMVIDEARGGFFGLRLEFKKVSVKRQINGGLSDEQIRMRNALVKNGYRVITVYGCDEALAALRQYMALPPTRGFPY